MTEWTVAGVLRAAAAIVESRGHCQWAAEDEVGRVCTSYALILAYTADGSDPVKFPAPVLLDAQAALRRLLGVDNLVAWNDRRGRTKEQVVAALREAADAAEAAT